MIADYTSNRSRTLANSHCILGTVYVYTDDGENVLAVELLWTPSQPGKTLSEKGLIMDYPDLIRL